MQAAQYLAVSQIKCALPRYNACVAFVMRRRRIDSGMLIAMKRNNGLMGMPAGMTQRMRQRALLGDQQEGCQRPPQGDGAQRCAEQAGKRHALRIKP